MHFCIYVFAEVVDVLKMYRVKLEIYWSWLAGHGQPGPNLEWYPMVPICDPKGFAHVGPT